jgi:hypothetical protein
MQLAHHCDEFLDDPALPSTPYMVQSNTSSDTFLHFMEMLDGDELHFSAEPLMI